MTHRIFGIVLGALLMSLAGPGAMAAVINMSGTGTAACPGSLGVTCDVAVSGMSGTQTMTDLNPLVLSIDLGSQNYLELYDAAGAENINLFSTPGGAILTNTSGLQNDIAVKIEFKNAGGTIIHTLNLTMVGPGFFACTGCGTLVNSFPVSLLFHSFDMTFTPTRNGITFNFDNFDKVQFNLFGSASNAGTVPEPGTLALLAIGMAGLGFAGWRRKRLPA